MWFGSRILVRIMHCAFLLAMVSNMIVLLTPSPVVAQRHLKVGIYQNVPLTFSDQKGQAAGFFIDILEAIAAKENWHLEYIPDSWPQCLANLKAGRIDLLGVIAYSPERNRHFDYNYESVLTEWGQIYIGNQSTIESLLDLEGKKIAVLRDDMHYLNLRELMKRSGLNCRFVEAFEYDAVLELVAIGRCDAGLVSQFFGMQYEGSYAVRRSPIIISPQKLYFAVPKDKNKSILHALDKHLGAFKKSKNSVYDQSLNRWFGNPAEPFLAPWVKWALALTASLLSLFLVLNLTLRAQVKSRTKELVAKNKALWLEIEHRRKAEKERSQMEKRLQRAHKMEAIGTLAGGVAHDLNNILSGLVSIPELLLLKEPPDSPLRKPLTTIKTSGEKAADIVQDLLTLARRGVANNEVQNLNSVIDDYVGSFECQRLLDRHAGVKLATELEPQLANIQGSRIHLAKTLMNLVTNAAEAMPRGGTIRIKTYQRFLQKPVKGYETIDPGAYAILEVGDDGTGIAPKDLDRLFEPFFTKKTIGRSGTGLGMAVVWGAVKDHRGYIDVLQGQSGGTIFRLYLPITDNAYQQPKTVVPLEGLMGAGEPILVVDDDQQQLDIAFEILNKLGYTPAVVSGGEEALTYLQTHRADVMILDMIMEPGIGGLETYRRVLKNHPHQKAIITSGFAETQDVWAAQRLGAGAYVKKPYTIEKIGLALKAELEGKHASTSS
jgi:signal transduction histidine kinase/ActR/RegA family two-component response regulator